MLDPLPASQTFRYGCYIWIGCTHKKSKSKLHCPFLYSHLKKNLERHQVIWAYVYWFYTYKHYWNQLGMTKAEGKIYCITIYCTEKRGMNSIQSRLERTNMILKKATACIPTTICGSMFGKETLPNNSLTPKRSLCMERVWNRFGGETLPLLPHHTVP